MKHTLLSIAGAGALMLAIASCGNEELVTLQQAGETTATDATLTEIIATIGGSSDTRTTATADDHGVKFTWAANDQLGIYTAEGRSAAYTYATESKFTNPDGLKGSAPFAAFYPYNAEGTVTDTPVRFTGQTQKGSSLEHINAYTYLAATGAQTDDKGALAIKLQHLACLVAIDLTLPEAGDLSSVTLSTNYAVFTSEGTVDLTAETPAITATEKVSSFKVNLEGVYANANVPVTVYMMMAPVDLSSRTVTATVKYANGTNYKGVLAVGKSLVAGKAYKLSANPTIKGETFLGKWSTYYNKLDMNHTSKIIVFEDGSYTITDWYDKEGYDLEFTSDGVTNYYDKSTWCYMSLGVDYSQNPSIYGATIDGSPEEGYYLAFYLNTSEQDYVYFDWPYTVDWILGAYTEAASGYEGVTVAEANTAFSYTDNAVTITKVDESTITLANLFNSVISQTSYADYPASLTGTVDLEKQTITFDPAKSTMMYYYTFADYSSVEKAVVATFDKDYVITIPNWTIWYGGSAYATAYNYNISQYAGVYSTLTPVTTSEE